MVISKIIVSCKKKNAMAIVKSTYHEFPNVEILNLISYSTSLKHLSFSLRNGEDNQKIFAYVSFIHENIKGLEGRGVRITEIENRNGAANGLFLDYILSAVINYKRKGTYHFDYLWFNPCGIYNITMAEALAKSIGFAYDKKTQIWFYRINRKE